MTSSVFLESLRAAEERMNSWPEWMKEGAQRAADAEEYVRLEQLRQEAIYAETVAVTELTISREKEKDTINE